MRPTKETSTKERIKIYTPQVKFIIHEYFDTLSEGQQKRFEKNREEYHDVCDKLMRIDKFTEEEIRKAIRFARNDKFWKSNFLSFSKLRQKNKEGVMWVEVFYEKWKVENSRRKNNRSIPQEVFTPAELDAIHNSGGPNG